MDLNYEPVKTDVVHARGIKGIRRLLKVQDRPLIGPIIKPKLGLKTRDHPHVPMKLG